MQLKLRGEDPRRPDRLCIIRIDSTLDGFETVVRRAAAAAKANGLSVSAATRANFAALGIDWGATATITPDEAGIEPVREHG